MSGECGEFQGDSDMKSYKVDEIGQERAPDDHESSKTDTDLDAAIEEAAKRRNLSTLNVKSIIHVRHVKINCIKVLRILDTVKGL